MRAVDPPVRREETLLVALLLGFVGGYLDTYTWITHGVLANAQTANLVFLWVNATAGRWQQAFHFVPSLFAFFVGVVVASWLRRVIGERAAQVSLLIEIGMLILVGVLHNRVPEVAGRARHLFGRRYAGVDLHQGRRLDLQLGDDHGQFSSGDRRGLRPGRRKPADRAAAKILHLHGRVRHVRDRRGRRRLHNRAVACAHPYHSRCGAPAGRIALREIWCDRQRAALIQVGP
jgi:Protein of unknown function (DUF1275)